LTIVHADSHGISAREGVTFLLHPFAHHRRTRADAACAVQQTGGSMSLQSRIESLKSRHASLETRIADEDHRPAPDSATLSRLKLEKLRLKEEMDRLRQTTSH
jgi:hypothetical protein